MHFCGRESYRVTRGAKPAGDIMSMDGESRSSKVPTWWPPFSRKIFETLPAPLKYSNIVYLGPKQMSCVKLSKTTIPSNT